MAYWLVNSGTSEDPLPGSQDGVAGSFADWDAKHGEVHGLDKPYKMGAGDVLIYRSAHTTVSRLVAVAEVHGPPVPEPLLRWSYRVPRTATAVVATLRNAPLSEDLGIKPFRVARRLEDALGDRAVRLITEAVRNPRTH